MFRARACRVRLSAPRSLTASVASLITAHAASLDSAEYLFAASFGESGAASGSWQHRTAGPDSCITETVTWTATTTAPVPGACVDGDDNDGDGKIDLVGGDPGCAGLFDTDETDPPPPVAPDTTAPSAALSGKKTQKAGRSVSVTVGCGAEACTATAAGTRQRPGDARGEAAQATLGDRSDSSGLEGDPQAGAVRQDPEGGQEGAVEACQGEREDHREDGRRGGQRLRPDAHGQAGALTTRTPDQPARRSLPRLKSPVALASSSCASSPLATARSAPRRSARRPPL